MRRNVLRSVLGMVRRDEAGSVSVLTAAFGLCLIGGLAVSVDVAHVYLAKRADQSALDLAALAAARDLSVSESAARAALAQNGVKSPDTLSVVIGRYTPDATTAPAARFVAGGQPANAVRLDMTTHAALFFGRAFLNVAPQLATRSTAVNTRVASFSVGSRQASLQGGVANALLSALLGGSVSLSVSDYNALADAQIEMPALLSSLATQTRVTAATYNDVLQTSPQLSDFIKALAGSSTSATAKSALQQLSQAAGRKTVPLGRLISFGPVGDVKLGDQAGLSASASILQTLTTALAAANGQSQIALDLGAQVPGLLGLTASITIGERPQQSPWFALGRENATVHTAQTRLRLNAKVGGVLGLAYLNLPVAVDAAAAEATLSSARCGRSPRTDMQATLAVTPAISRVWIGEPRSLTRWNDMTSAADVGPATIADALLLSATASAYVGAENLRPTQVSFTASEIGAGVVKTVATSSIMQSTLASLTQNLVVTVKLNPLGLGLGTPKVVGDTLSKTLSPVGALLDPTLNSLLRLLGVGLGEADVTVRGMRCDGSVLVG
ncbi:MAG: hypothetical protein DI565_07940 [Ancylobacter novellus]|uniref:Uncharacterized protein n=1 Tax=Ancylobacter novellus TaxID=921 RepID=A0A2W5KIC5_ANCNO|nr:MAG: hypothetical protein DI565_07940 [Ancylobacter novellus]